MPGFKDPQLPTLEWFHENTLIIRGTSATLDKVPITIDTDGSKGYSAADGGFYTFKGKLTGTPDRLILHLKLVDSCYVMRRADGSDIDRTYSGRAEGGGTLTVEGVRYDLKKK